MQSWEMTIQARRRPIVSAEKGGIVSVEKWRPQPFQLVCDSEFAQKPEVFDRHLGFRQPSRLRRVDERKWNADREAETQHGRVAAIFFKVGQHSRHAAGLRFGVGFRVHSAQHLMLRKRRNDEWIPLADFAIG